MIAALIQGDLTGDPAERTTAKGGKFWTASLRVAAGAEAMFIGIATFSESAGARLLRSKKGDSIAAVGSLEQTVWEGRDGEQRAGWRLTAHEVMSVYEAQKRRVAAVERVSE